MLNSSITIGSFTEHELRVIASALHAYREILLDQDQSAMNEIDRRYWDLDVLAITAIQQKLAARF